MGKHSFNLGLYGRSVQWFEEAWVQAGREGNATVSQGQVAALLDTAVTAVSAGD